MSSLCSIGSGEGSAEEGAREGEREGGGEGWREGGREGGRKGWREGGAGRREGGREGGRGGEGERGGREGGREGEETFSADLVPQITPLAYDTQDASVFNQNIPPLFGMPHNNQDTSYYSSLSPERALSDARMFSAIC